MTAHPANDIRQSLAIEQTTQAVAATGTITVANGGGTDEDIVTVTDAFGTAVTFQATDDGTVTDAAYVPVAIGVDGDATAITLAAAINAQGDLRVSAVVDGSTLDQVNVTALDEGTTGNQTITETGSSFTVAGLASGADAAAAIGLYGHSETNHELVVHKRADGRVSWTSPIDNVVYSSYDEMVVQLFDDLVEACTLTE